MTELEKEKAELTTLRGEILAAKAEIDELTKKKAAIVSAIAELDEIRRQKLWSHGEPT